jgi:membrane dipeptidase
MNLIIDSHEDLAWNIINLKRDYTQSADDIRKREKNTPIPDFNGNTLLGWPQYQQGKVGIIFGTLFCSPHRLDSDKYPLHNYETPLEAHNCYRKNLDAYLKLTDENPDKFRLILNQNDLSNHLDQWIPHVKNPMDPPPPVGIVVLMEGAEGILAPDRVADWFEWGVRIIGPAWAGNRYCGGTREPGPLTKAGYELLEAMADLNIVLDISHMDHQSARQALDFYPGQMIASHSNAESLIKNIPTNRHLKDETIQQLIERDGVMGIVPVNTFLDWSWRKSGGRKALSLDHIVAQIDYVCQIAGNTQHVGLGTDFDGGFGVESVPPEIDTIADLTKLAPKLFEKGYNEKDINYIFSGNWLRIIKNNLPTS